MAKTILRTEHLRAYYLLDEHGTQKAVKAVDDISLDIHENEVYGIAGESGCGKTTLLKALGAAIEPPLKVIAGNVVYRLNGRDHDASWFDTPAKNRLRRGFVSYVPQGSANGLDPTASLRETLVSLLESYARTADAGEANEIVRRHVAGLGLPLDLLESCLQQLPDGPRQSAAVAVATLLRPRIVIGDEQTTVCDVTAQREATRLLMDVQHRLRNTVILVAHDMGLYADHADRVGIMFAGKIVEEAPTEVILGAPVHPYTEHLVRSRPRFAGRAPSGDVPAGAPSLLDPPGGCPFHTRCAYALDICAQRMPGFTRLGAGHRVACWLAGAGESA